MQQTPMNLQLIIDNLWPVLTLGFAGFALATIFTPVYTTLAFRCQWWKKPRVDSVSGEKAAIYQKIHAKNTNDTYQPWRVWYSCSRSWW